MARPKDIRALPPLVEARDDALRQDRLLPTMRKTGDGAGVPAAKARPDPLVAERPRSRPPRWGRSLSAVSGAVALAGLALGYRYGWPRAAEPFVVSKSTLDIDLRGPGMLDAIRKATISARVQGRITEIRVDRNDIVGQGDLIARIASEDLANQVAAADASYEAAQRAVLQARADKARYDATFANARTSFARQETLRSQGWAAQAAYDSALASRRQSQADLQRADAAIEAAEAQMRSAAAMVRANQAVLDEANIRAPFAGLIVSRDRNLGDVVTPGASIVQLVDPSAVVLTARFDESAIAAVHAGQAARLRFASEPDRTISGRVLRLSRQVDTETREFTADIAPDELPVNWAVGQRGTAVITIARRHDASTVPSRYVAWRDGRPGLWVLVDGRARWRPVELGEAGGEFVEVRSGVTGGDAVLAPDGMFEWMRVRAKERAP